MKIKWPKVEYGGLISAAASLDYGFRQQLADVITATLAVRNHVVSCKMCQAGDDCEELNDIAKQIEKRMRTHDGFLKTVKKLEDISKWYKPSPEESSVMHNINQVVNFYKGGGARKKSEKK